MNAAQRGRHFDDTGVISVLARFLYFFFFLKRYQIPMDSSEIRFGIRPIQRPPGGKRRTLPPPVGVSWRTLEDDASVSAKSTRGPGDCHPARPSVHPEHAHTGEAPCGSPGRDLQGARSS